MGENTNIPYPQWERSIKIPVFKQQRVPNTGTKNRGNWGELGKIGEKFAWCARRANVLSQHVIFDPGNRQSGHYFTKCSDHPALGCCSACGTKQPFPKSRCICFCSRYTARNEMAPKSMGNPLWLHGGHWLTAASKLIWRHVTGHKRHKSDDYALKKTHRSRVSVTLI